MAPKMKMHTSMEERIKRHRRAQRLSQWGHGVTEGATFTWDMLHPSFWGAWLSIALLWLLVTCLPYKAILALGRLIGSIMYRYLKSRRYVVETNIKLAFPEKSAAEQQAFTKDVFANAGMAVLETGIAWFWPDWRLKKLLIVDEAEIKRARALAETNPRTIAFTCHMVTLELGARLYAMAVRPGIGVYRSSDHQVWEYIQVKGRLRANLALVERMDVRSMVKSVLKGYPIWYAPDQDYGTRSAVFVPFFGVDKTCTVTGLHDLARLKEVIVQPFWTVRESKGYRLHIKAPLENFPTEDATQDTARANKEIEEMIMTAPTQYLWMHRRFKNAPPGEPSRYPEVE